MAHVLAGRRFVGNWCFPDSCAAPGRETGRAGSWPISSSEGGDARLRSTQALNGYHIQTDEGAIGHVIDFIVDHESWAICHLVVETGHWFSGKEIVISPNQIIRISYDESKVFVSVTKESILKAPGYHVPPWAFNDAPLATSQL